LNEHVPGFVKRIQSDVALLKGIPLATQDVEASMHADFRHIEEVEATARGLQKASSVQKDVLDDILDDGDIDPADKASIDQTLLASSLSAESTGVAGGEAPVAAANAGGH